jgi:hypothetical protein
MFSDPPVIVALDAVIAPVDVTWKATGLPIEIDEPVIDPPVITGADIATPDPRLPENVPCVAVNVPSGATRKGADPNVVLPRYRPFESAENTLDPEPMRIVPPLIALPVS